LFNGRLSHAGLSGGGEEKEGGGDCGQKWFHGVVLCWKIEAESSRVKGEPSRQQLKTSYFFGTNDLEVSAVSRKDGPCAQPLGHCDDRCIHKINPRISVLPKKPGRSAQISGLDWATASALGPYQKHKNLQLSKHQKEHL